VTKPVNLPDTPKNFSNIVPLEVIAAKNTQTTKSTEFISKILFIWPNNRFLLDTSKVIKVKLKQVSKINLGIFTGSYEVSGVIAKVIVKSAKVRTFDITSLLLSTYLV
jgi:hypothetical protein